MALGKLSQITSFGKSKLSTPKSMDNIKQKFFKYLEDNDKTGKIDSTELITSDVSIFMYAGEFKQFIEKEGSNFGLESDFSGSFTDLLEMEFDEKNSEFLAGKDATKEQKTLVGIINELFKSDDVQKATDLDGNGKLTQEEMTNFLQLMNEYDEDKENLSLEDFFGAVEGIEEGTFNPAQGLTTLNPDIISNNGVNEPIQPQPVSNIGPSGASGGESVGSSGSINPVYPNNGVPASKLETKSNPTEASNTQAKSITEIDKKITEKNNEITGLNSEKVKVYSDNKEYKTLVDDLNETTKTISTSKSNITTLETTLHEAQTSISSVKAELSNLKDPLVFSEYKDEIEQRRRELTTMLSNLDQKEKDTQTQLDKENETVKTNEEKQKTLEKQISDFEKNNPNEQIDEINSKIETLKKDISSLKQQKQQKETEIKKTREQEKSDSKVYGEMKAYRQSEFVKYMMDLATSDSIANEYNNANWGGAWCAVFTSDMTEKLYAEVSKRLGMNIKQTQDLNGNQMAMHATAWGKLIQETLNNSGINKQATINISSMTLAERKDAVRKGLIYPGMTFEYEANGGYHTGFIESINSDLTWNTIEGNSTGGKVGSNRRDATNNRLTSVTDSTLKCYYWLLIEGLASKEEVNKLLNG